ncbi:MAG TPA: histone deacetylase [Micromonosporaceae bacterium]|nr:histone deacetylase [Micromonosporaceae bacterium]
MTVSWRRLPSFAARPSLLESLERRFNGVLCAYWRISRWLYGILLGGLASWFLQSALQQGLDGTPDLLQRPPAQPLAALFWPVVVPVVLVVVASLVVAGRAHRDQLYYELLDASAKGYRNARKGYLAIAAQLREADSHAGARPGWSDDGLAVFDDQLYTERSDAVDVYHSFVQQRSKRILLVVGRGGSGKSTFLLRRMAELAGQLAAATRRRRLHPCVFVNCKLDHINDTSRLSAIIRDKLQGVEFTEVLRRGVRGRHERALVIFVDAINENVAPPGDDINVHLTNFARDYLSGQYQIYLCISVRRTYWDEQRRRIAANPTSSDLGWLDYVYLPERAADTSAVAQRGAETASVLLEDFDREEFDSASRRHRAVYDITGDIRDERTRRICSNPLMLQIFCVTFRGQDIGDLEVVRHLVRDKDIFDAYATTALGRAAEQIGASASTVVRHGENLAQRAVRGLLLELALGMVQHGRQFLSSDEVFAIAQARAEDALSVRGRRVNTVEGLYREGSALKAILDEGIVLESGLGVLPGAGQVSGIRFVSERYLEYSIGRGIVRRWRLDGLGRDEILDDFRRRMAQHIALREQSFDNLRQGLGMAVLVTEKLEEPLPPLPRGIHFDLLDVLVRDVEFDWNQLACRVVQQLTAFNRAAADAGADRHDDVETLLGCLDELAKKNDFVLRWDVERALLHAVEAGEGGAVLRHLQAWLEPSATFAQRLFGGESVGFLFRHREDYQQDVVKILQRIIATATEMDFWIVRSIMFSIGTMMDTLDSDADPAGANGQLRGELQRLPQELLRFGRQWWDRSVVLAGQIERDALYGRLGPWLAWPWPAESPWTRVNAALAAEQAATRGLSTMDTVGLLREIWRSSGGYDPHLSWAVWHVLGQVTAAQATRAQVRDAAAQLSTQIQDEAQQNLARDSRTAWVALPEPAREDRLSSQVTTSVALVYHPEYGRTDLHNHPESKERVQAILDCLEVSGLRDGQDWRDLWTYVSPYQFRDWDAEAFLRRVHTREWIRRVQELSRRLAEEKKPDIVLESDLEVRAGSYEGAELAVRGAVCAVDLVTSVPALRLAVALVRPPGHLAGNKICIFNNIAVAARHGQDVLAASDGGRRERPRVLIVDTDAHHGKSTQDIFYNDASVLYFSVHQAGVHPGTGLFRERGAGAGAGYTVNVPIPASSGDSVYSAVLRRVLRPILSGFRPQLVLVSLGLDSYHRDSFSQLEMSEWSYRELASTIRDYCQQDPGADVAAFFEGGYDLASLGRCVLQFMSVFGGWDPPTGGDPTPRHGTSPLDRHLLDGGDTARTGLSLSRNDRLWVDDFQSLEAEIRRQWNRPGVGRSGP